MLQESELIISALGLTLDAGDTMVVAYIGGTQVGSLELNQDENDHHFWVWNVNVDEQYQGKGIGRMMVEKANSEIAEVYFSSASPDEYKINGQSESTFYLTEEGVALAKSCVKHGIIREDQYVNPFAHTYRTYNNE